MSGSIDFHNPPTVAPPVGAYSHLAVVPSGTELLVVAGQLGVRPDGSLPGSPEEQYAQALDNVMAVLASRGASSGHLIKLNTYLVRPIDLDAVRAVRTRVLGTAAPPATLVYVAALARPEYLVEVEAWAARPPAD